MYDAPTQALVPLNPTFIIEIIFPMNAIRYNQARWEDQDAIHCRSGTRQLLQGTIYPEGVRSVRSTVDYLRQLRTGTINTRKEGDLVKHMREIAGLGCTAKKNWCGYEVTLYNHKKLK